ncbi:MAG: 6-phosphogluconolactonase [Planctomycetota bacterium]|jgi:6-phosphogluconolactonase
MTRQLPTIRVANNPSELTEFAFEAVQRAEAEAIDARGVFHFVFSGGSTPKPLYALIAASEGAGFRFDRWHIWFGDERFVSMDHKDSNYAMAESALLSRVPIPRSQIHRVRTELATPQEAAVAYEADLCEEFHLQPGQTPRMDLVLLGMGDDGHTGSLFPGSELARCREGLAVGGLVEKLGAQRVSLTAQTFNAGRQLVFLVTGAGKASTVREVIEGDLDLDRLPSQRIAPEDGRLLWLLDKPAAGSLSRYSDLT